MKEYDANFFEEQYLNGDNSNYGESYFSEEKIKAKRNFCSEIMLNLNPKRVLEIGCAYGYHVKFFNEIGVEAHGVDISNYAITNRKHEN